MKTITTFKLSLLVFLISCNENQKISKDFTFTIQTIGYTIDAKNDKYTVHTLRGDTTTQLNLSHKDWYQIQRLFLSKDLHKLPTNFSPTYDNTIMGTSGTKLIFKYNKSIYSFIVFDHERYGFFDSIKVKKIERFTEEVYQIINKKENIRHMPKSNTFSL